MNSGVEGRAYTIHLTKILIVILLHFPTSPTIFQDPILTFEAKMRKSPVAAVLFVLFLVDLELEQNPKQREASITTTTHLV